MTELYVLEWSKQQNCLHIQPAYRTAETNLRAFMLDNALNDYHVLVVGTREECDRVANRLRHKIISRDRPKAEIPSVSFAH